MIIFTILGIITAAFFFIVILMSIIETRIKNRTKKKLLWNMDKVEKNRSYKEIQKANEK
jgi:predicted membrane protein|tara:strand:+ start:507 stop:683 length:177 start_codon:yes stop_codon:yes gene_type:complete